MKRYEKLRGPCQETYYNVARMFHQMNILPVAIHFYNKCLQVGDRLLMLFFKQLH